LPPWRRRFLRWRWLPGR